MTKYQCWKSESGCSITFAPIENIIGLMECGMLEDDAELLYSIEAEDYNNAMQQHYDRQGWGKYNPMENK